MNALGSAIVEAISPHLTSPGFPAGAARRGAGGAARVVTRDESRSLGALAPTARVSEPPLASAGKPASTKKKPRLISDRQALSGAIVDYVSVTVRPSQSELEWLKQDPQTYAQHLVASLFPRTNVFSGDPTGRGGNGYTDKINLFANRAKAGAVYYGGNNDTVSVTLTGTGCAAVPCWHDVVAAFQLRGDCKLTRVDLAFDDFEGIYIDNACWFQMASRGEIRGARGPGNRPPRTAGPVDKATWYIGKKGNKELCVYHKGVEQGDPDSPWLRAEVRFWDRDRVLPFAMLTQSLSYLRAAYNVLAELPGDVAERIKTVRKKCDTKIATGLSWLRNAAGQFINVLAVSLGEERAADILVNECRRTGVPRRFQGLEWTQLNRQLQATLCPF